MIIVYEMCKQLSRDLQEMQKLFNSNLFFYCNSHILYGELFRVYKIDDDISN